MSSKQKTIREKENKKDNKKNKKIKSKAKKRKGKIIKLILMIILLILIVLAGIFAYRVHKNGGGVSGILATVVGHDENTIKELKEFRVLLLGISTDQEDVYLTDTIMIASYNPNTQKASLVSIPRDTYMGSSPSYATAYEKINAYYARENRPDETLEAINDVTGLDIEYYVVVKTEALIEIVDAIGGVTFNVPINMNYTDTSQDLVIDLDAGEQLLNGDQAEQLLRFRHNDNYTTYPEEYGTEDTGRMRTQREFIEAAVAQTLVPENIFKLYDFIEIIADNVITNIDIDYIKDYIPYAVEFSTENLETAVIPGVNTNENSSGTWIYKINKTDMNEMFNELFVERDLVEEEVEDGETKKEDLKIEVLNGTTDSQILSKVIEKLEDAGFNVTREGTTNSTSRTTITVDSTVSESSKTNIKNILGIGLVANSESDRSTVDVTIIIGNDYVE